MDLGPPLYEATAAEVLDDPPAASEIREVTSTADEAGSSVVAVAEVVPGSSSLQGLPSTTASFADGADGGAASAAEVSAVAHAVGGAVDGEKQRRRRSGGSAQRWSPGEETTLRELVTELGVKRWAEIAERLSTGRTAAGVEQHWQIMSGKRKRNGTANAGPVQPTPEVTAAIAAAPREPPPSGVDKPKRQRKSSGKVARWTTEEEELLRALVDELGAGGHWAAIAERLAAGGFQKRTGAGVDQHYQLMTGRRKKYGGVGGGTAADGAAADATAVTAVEVAAADAEPAAVAAVIAAPSVEEVAAAAAGGEVFAAAQVDVPPALDGAAAV